MKHTSKILALVLVVMTVLMSLSVFSVSAETATVTKVFEASSLEPAAQGAFTDGKELIVGTDDFFTLVMSAKVKIDSSTKTFEDGYKSGQRVNWGGSSTTSKNIIKFTVDRAATVKVWWASGENGRTVALWDADGNSLGKNATTSVKNSPYLDTYSISGAGTYAIACPDGSNYIFKVEVSWEVELCDHEGGTATCKEQATCSKCGEKYDDLAEHTLGTAATCTAQAVCSVCGASYGEKADHSYNGVECIVCHEPDPDACQHTVLSDATCTEPKKCTTDGCDYFVEGSELGHDMITDAAVPATCTTAGKTEGSHCSRCDGATTAQAEVKALGHTLTFVNTPATAEAAGKTTASCSACDQTYDFGEVKVMTPGTYTLDAETDLAGISAGDFFDGQVKVVDEVFACHLSAKYKTDGSTKAFEALNWTATTRMNFGGKSEFLNNGVGEEAVRNGGLKNYIQIVTTGETTITVAWVRGGDGRELAVYDMEGKILDATDHRTDELDDGKSGSSFVTTFELPAGSYLIGTDCSHATGGGGNYIFRVIVDVHTHEYAPATCTEPSKCSCGLTQGEALGHTWVDADCDTPKTCSVCDATEGEALGHTWVDASCTDAKKCSVCGATEGEALGHDYKDGACTRCEAEDPNYGPPVEEPKDEEPKDEPQPEPQPELNFFQKIIAWITSFFSKILGIFKK